jgi:hypothetical protein
LSQKTQTALSALPSPVSNQTVLSTNVQLLQERLALIHSVVSMSEQVRLVEMMHAVAAVMVQFPEIQLTDVTFEAGTDQVNQGFMHDHQHQRIHLMGSVDATRVGSLQAEVALLKRLLDALSHIAQVREVAQVDGQLMTLDQKAFSVSLSQDHMQSVRHTMHLVLQVRSE